MYQNQNQQYNQQQISIKKDGRKMIKLNNPMSILQTKLLQNIKKQSQSQCQDNQIQQIKINFNIDIQSEYQLLHFQPQKYQSKQFQGSIQTNLFQNSFNHQQIKACQIIQKNQSLLYHSYNYHSCHHVLAYLLNKCRKQQKKIIIFTNTTNRCYQLYNNFKNYISTKLFLTSSISDIKEECIICTASQLNHMIYIGNNQLQCIDWVIAESFQLMFNQEEEDGYFVQQMLITLPLRVRLILLTNQWISNAASIGQWLSKIRNTAFNIILSNNQQQMIQEYVCAIGDNSIIKINNLPSFQSKKTQLLNLLIKKSFDDIKKRNTILLSNLINAVKSLLQLNFQPILILQEQKRQIQQIARNIIIKYDLTNKQQKDKIDFIFSRVTMCLNEEQKGHACVIQFQQLLRKGIAIYHRGLLPILIELVQILCQQSLMKVVVAQSSLFFHLNIKISTIITSPLLKKSHSTSQIGHDLKKRQIPFKNKLQLSKIKQYLLANSATNNHKTYLLHILMHPEQLLYITSKKSASEHKELHLMKSIYRLTFNMMLSHLRFQDMNSQYIIRRSFKWLQYKQQNNKQKQSLIQDQYRKQLQQPRNQFYKILLPLQQRLQLLEKQYKSAIQKPNILIPHLTIGRIIYLKYEKQQWGYGILINFHKKRLSKKQNKQQTTYLLDCMVFIVEQNGVVRCCRKYEQSTNIGIVTFALSAVQYVMSIKIILPNDLISQQNRLKIYKTLTFLKNKYQMPRLTFQLFIPTIKSLQTAITQLHQQISSICLPQLKSTYIILNNQQRNINYVNSQNNSQQQLFKQQLKVYRKLARSYNIVQKSKLTIKGVYVNRINSYFNVFLIQLINRGELQNLNAEEMVSMIGMFVEMKEVVTARGKVAILSLRRKIDEILKVAKQVAQVYVANKIIIQEEEYLDKIKEGYVQALYQWIKGSSFMDVCIKHQIFQGTLHRFLTSTIHLIQQLFLVCQQLQKQVNISLYSNYPMYYLMAQIYYLVVSQQLHLSIPSDIINKKYQIQLLIILARFTFTLQSKRTLQMQQWLLNGQIGLSKLQEKINDFRINMNLRILWVDHQINDLIHEGIKIMQLDRYATSTPFIVHLVSFKQIQEYPFNSNLYNHIAFHKVHTFIQYGQRLVKIYAILTKRGIAVDELLSNYRRDAYVITAQVSQLNTQTYLWGTQILANETIQTISPKYIIKRNSLWFLQFQSITPIKNILFYSVKRQYSSYGTKNHHPALPKDAKLQYCIKFKNYSSHLQKTFNKQIIPLISMTTIKTPSKFPLLYNPLQDKLSANSNTKNKNKSSKDKKHNFQQKIQKIKSSQSQVQSVINKERSQTKTNKQQDDIEPFNGNLIIQQRIDNTLSNSIIVNVSNSIIKELILQYNQIFKEDDQILEYMMGWKIDDVIKEVYYIAREGQGLQRKYQIVLEYLVVLLVTKALDQPYKDQIYFAILQHLPLLSNIQNKTIIHSHILHILKQNFYKLTKDNQINFPKYQKYLGQPVFRQLCLYTLDHHKQQINHLSDLLLIYTIIENNTLEENKKIENLQEGGRSRILEMYIKKERDCGIKMIVGLWEWIYEKYNVGLQLQKPVVITLKQFPYVVQILGNRKTVPFQSTKINNSKIHSNLNNQAMNINISFENILKNQLIIAPIRSASSHFVLYIHRNTNNLSIFLQQHSKLNSGSKVTQCYNINSKVMINKDKQYILDWMGYFGWPNMSCGSEINIQLKQFQACNIKISLQISKDILFQSIYNYLRQQFDANFLKLLSIPKDDNYNTNIHNHNIHNNDTKWLNRRSSFLLNSDLIQPSQPYYQFPFQCLRHRQCQKCTVFNTKFQIFNLKPCHFYLIILSSQFISQMHALLITLKYLSLSLHQQQQIDVKLWTSHLRIDYVSIKDILQLIMNNEFEQKINMLIRELIEIKMKRSVIQNKKDSQYISKPRNISQLFTYIEPQYSEIYLKYINTIK